MDYFRENDLRQIAHPDGRRVLQSWIAGDWRELADIEIVAARLAKAVVCRAPAST